MSVVSCSTTSTTAYKVTADTTGTLVMQTGATPTTAVTIDTAQNVGIGTTSPGTRLHVYGASNELARLESSSTSFDAALRLYQNGTQITNLQGGVGAVGGGTNLYTVTNAALVFGTNNTERARIDSSGNLLVGTTTASGKVAIVYDGGSVVGENINDSANTTNSTLMQFAIQGTQVGTIKRVAATSAVVYNTTSDYRLKTVVGAVTGQGERIDALKPVDYLWKDGNAQARGFLAHEFQELYPQSVSGEKDAVDADGNPVYQAMQASTPEVIADLVAEIQSLRQRLAALENK